VPITTPATTPARFSFEKPELPGTAFHAPAASSQPGYGLSMPRPSFRPRFQNGAPPHLTAREREVLILVAEGLANKEVAVRLGISIKTVEKHREHLMNKLDIHNTAGLTRYAIGAGIVEQELFAV
jgi:DNA-binding CsgD family transcriptional regulator